MRRDWEVELRLLWATLVVLSAFVSPAVATVPHEDGEVGVSQPTVRSPQFFGQQTTPTNNSSQVIHENPDEVDDENELDTLLSYLSGRMNTDIDASTVALSQRQYDAAKAALGDDYDDSLGKYVEVDGETDGDGAGDQYATVQETQRAYIETVQSFRETRSAYRAAKQAGDDARARELARRLTRLADDAERQSARISTAFAVISNRTGSDLSESQTRLASIQANVSEQRDAVVEREFVDTRMAVESYDQEISFTDPFVLSGTLVAENGTPVDVDTARFTIGKQTIRTPVRADGSFTLTYRPTRVPVNTSTLTVHYRPASTSLYRTTTRSLAVSITQTDATARVTEPARSAYGYADTLAVDVALVVNETPVRRFPISASLAGSKLVTGATKATGNVTLTGTVGASVSTGDATVRVAPSREPLAVGFDPVTTNVDITSEQTALDATARPAEGGSLVVQGALSTREGDPVDGQPVVVHIGNRTLTTTTDGSGTYRTAVRPPTGASNESATITVEFDGGGTNLESSSATTSVESVETGGSPVDASNAGGLSAGFPPSVTDFLWAAAAVGFVGLATVVLLRRRTATEVPEMVDADLSSLGDTAEGELDLTTETTPLESARAMRSAGNQTDAVVVAYTAVRRALADAADIDDSATHWEFADRCVAAGVADGDLLETLTAGYEKAAYSGVSVSDTEAEELVEVAATLVAAA
ncbi:DUF4129 domain-containing protein [Haloferax namakaokahaiae]|uniref:DUF4129 domain-containing protein n=1 Tax=Haloferax namakaokahaiae TaxID=1748331 RepID=A0ABD5ZCK9_9EURY